MQPHTHTHTREAALSPQYAAPPMYKLRTAARRAGEQARHQDVKMEKSTGQPGRNERELF